MNKGDFLIPKLDFAEIDAGRIGKTEKFYVGKPLGIEVSFIKISPIRVAENREDFSAEFIQYFQRFRAADIAAMNYRFNPPLFVFSPKRFEYWLNCHECRK